ncbi:MAG TPA: 50S ribosomal protein L11 methyltransferase, partial [Candidatus Sulfotelmatobacter sp.]|nr:50S ribosomal protein L11 methyltransferase [Candidatus Sulfotelmatobacter sp.]
MNQRPLWKLSIVTSPEAEEAVAEMLGGAFGEPAASYTDLESGTTTITAYFAQKPDWSRARQTSLRTELKRIASCGLKIGPDKFALGKVRRQDWAESWKRHFKPLEIGSALLIRPSWSQRRPRKGQALVVLDPGLSFGTGQHPTTGFCLQQLVACRRPKQGQSLLDIGSGSGILAIAAVRLGYQPVEAFDFDPEAVRVARDNAQQNGVAEQIDFRQQD